MRNCFGCYDSKKYCKEKLCIIRRKEILEDIKAVRTLPIFDVADKNAQTILLNKLFEEANEVINNNCKITSQCIDWKHNVLNKHSFSFKSFCVSILLQLALFLLFQTWVSVGVGLIVLSIIYIPMFYFAKKNKKRIFKEIENVTLEEL